MTSNRAEPELQRLLQLPWTVIRETTPEGDQLLRVKEIPSAVGCGVSEEERVHDLWNALTESLRAYLQFGDPVPMPQGVSELWKHVIALGEHKPGLAVVNSAATSTGAISAYR